MRAEKLGDLEGANRALRGRGFTANGSDAEALEGARRSLRQDRAHGRLPAHDWSGLASVAPEGEKLATLRKLAAELRRIRDPSGAAPGLRQADRGDPNADDAYRGSSACSKGRRNWHDARALYNRHIAAVKTPGAARGAVPRSRECLRESAREPRAGDRVPVT